MSSTAAANLTSTGSYADARYSKFIQARLQEYGRKDYALADYLEAVSIPGGHSATYQITRKARIPTPLAALTESVTPSATTLTLDTVTGTSTQYGILCSWSDVAELQQRHSLLEQATDEIADAMQRLRQWIASTAYIALTNVYYPSTVTARGSLAATNVMDTATARKALKALRAGLDTKLGAPMPREGTMFVALAHPEVIAQLRGDVTFERAATSCKPEWLEKGIVAAWEGLLWRECNHMPVFTNIGTGMAADAITSGGAEADDATGGLAGLRVTINAAGALGDAVHYLKVTRRHRWTGFEDGVSSILSLADTNDATSSYDVVAPSDTDYVYNFYFGDTNSNSDLFLVQSNIAAGGTFNIAAEVTSGTNPPAHPAKGVTVYPTIVMGMNFGKMVTLDNARTYVVTGPDKNDQLNQQTFAGAKVHQGAFICQDDFALRIETGA